MLVVTTENVSGHRVTEVNGQCFGVVVRSRGLGGNIIAGLRSIAGKRTAYGFRNRLGRRQCAPVESVAAAHNIAGVTARAVDAILDLEARRITGGGWLSAADCLLRP
jgi:Putative heavy-metal-binding